MKKKLESLYNDFSNASQLLSVIEKGVWECSEIANGTYSENKSAELFREISYGLIFVSNALQQKSEELLSLIDDMAE